MSAGFSGIRTLQFTPDNKYCYCYSGEFTASNAMQLIMQFKTGSYYLVSETRLAGMTDMGSPASGNVVACRVVFGNEETGTINTNPQLTMLHLKTEGGAEDMPFSDTGKLIIPPFTNVQFFVDMDSTNSSYDGGITFTAEVKGTVEQFNLEL